MVRALRFALGAVWLTALCHVTAAAQAPATPVMKAAMPPDALQQSSDRPSLGSGGQLLAYLKTL